MGRVVAVVVIADLQCPPCSAIARELPDLLRVPVQVLGCRDPRLPATVPAAVRACRRPAVATVDARGDLTWWPGLTGAAGVLPLVRPGSAREAVVLLLAALRARG